MITVGKKFPKGGDISSVLTESVSAILNAMQNIKVINMVKAVHKYMDEINSELYDTPAEAIAAENKSKSMQPTSGNATINTGTQIEMLYDDAREQTIETLPEFLEQVSAIARCDWNCNKGIAAITISAIAASWAMESEQGLGTSGSQTRYIMAEYMLRYGNISTPANIVEYMEMLNPRNAKHFERTISRDTWKCLQAEATKRLQNAPPHMDDRVRTHLQSIVDGVPPFGYDVEVD